MLQSGTNSWTAWPQLFSDMLKTAKQHGYIILMSVVWYNSAWFLKSVFTSLFPLPWCLPSTKASPLWHPHLCTSLSGTPKTEANNPLGGRIFHTMYHFQRLLWRRRLQAGEAAEKSIFPGPWSWSWIDVPMWELPKSWHCIQQRGLTDRMLHINLLCSGHFWVNPSSNIFHILGVQVNSRGRKKHVWSYTFLLCPFLPKKAVPLHGPFFQTFCSFEWFSYSETASLNFA